MDQAETLIACIRLILDDPEADVYVGDGPSAYRNEALSIQIRRLSSARVGVDERRYSVDPDDGTLRERIYGNRLLRIQVDVDTPRQSAFEETAEEVADDLIAGFSRTDIAALLNAIDLGTPRAQPTRVNNLEDEHRDVRSIATFELWFPASRRHVVPVANSPGRITSTTVTGEADPGDHVLGPGLVGPPP